MKLYNSEREGKKESSDGKKERKKEEESYAVCDSEERKGRRVAELLGTTFLFVELPLFLYFPSDFLCHCL